MSVMDTPRTMEGRASGRSADTTMRGMDAPHASAASMASRGTSASDCSTMRATNGVVESTRGGMTPRTPVVVPTRARVTGNMVTSRMMNGMERPMLTTHPRTAFSVRMGRSPRGAVTQSTTPSRMPST